MPDARDLWEVDKIVDPLPNPTVKKLAERILASEYVDLTVLKLDTFNHNISCRFIDKDAINNILDLLINEFSVPRSEMVRLKQVAEITPRFRG